MTSPVDEQVAPKSSGPSVIAIVRPPESRLLTTPLSAVRSDVTSPSPQRSPSKTIRLRKTRRNVPPVSRASSVCTSSTLTNTRPCSRMCKPRMNWSRTKPKRRTIRRRWSTSSTSTEFPRPAVNRTRSEPRALKSSPTEPTWTRYASVSEGQRYPTTSVLLTPESNAEMIAQSRLPQCHTLGWATIEGGANTVVLLSVVENTPTYLRST